MIEVMIRNTVGCQTAEAVMIETIRCVLRDHQVAHGEVSLAIIDDAAMQTLNRTHLQHDYATDVLSFLLDRDHDTLEGEVIVSAETASQAADEYGWSSSDELLLYVIHGTLHLVGYDDRSAADRRSMRDREAHYLNLAGIRIPDDSRQLHFNPRDDEENTSREAPV